MYIDTGKHVGEKTGRPYWAHTTYGEHRLGLPMVVCVACLPADKPWDVVSVTRRSSGVAPRAGVRVYARVLVPPNLYIHTYRNAAMTVYIYIYIYTYI